MPVGLVAVLALIGVWTATWLAIKFLSRGHRFRHSYRGFGDYYYEYYSLEDHVNHYQPGSSISRGKNYAAWGNLGAQGWRYIAHENGFYIFERKKKRL